MCKDCVVAIDGTHIRVQVARQDAPKHHGRKDYLWWLVKMLPSIMVGKTIYGFFSNDKIHDSNLVLFFASVS